LKTDLNIRPIHHQKDQYIEPHIWLGIIAYQVVNYIRQTLKTEGHQLQLENDCRKNESPALFHDQYGCQRQQTHLYKAMYPTKCRDEKIYDALNFKDRPYVRKSKVVTQL